MSWTTGDHKQLLFTFFMSQWVKGYEVEQSCGTVKISSGSDVVFLHKDSVQDVDNFTPESVKFLRGKGCSSSFVNSVKQDYEFYMLGASQLVH